MPMKSKHSFRFQSNVEKSENNLSLVTMVEWTHTQFNTGLESSFFPLCTLLQLELTSGN